MPSTEQLRTKLIDKLKELFQLNQPDLDFGFYRIMHAKSEQVINFIEHDLFQVIQDAFGQVDETNKAKLKQELDTAIQTAKDFGAPDPETTSKVVEARARYEAIRDGANSEAEIYDHLYRFFERYYDEGDFISRRYYTRETPGKAAPFAVPYNGEEVKLHWANADQYYIKTTEYFTNFTVNLTEAVKNLRESQKSISEQMDLVESAVPEGLKLQFRIMDATEGEHANVKASDATKRYFIINKDNPVELNDNNELIINFEYRPDQAGAKQDALNKSAVSCLINALKTEPKMAAYYEYLSLGIPTEKEKDRILLTKYINQYTARNTMDYFIHKNLGAFLKRELDFYIKNEVMRLDDIENAEVPKVEDYLAKLRVLRQIATKLIDFMAQLEDFQKKLWLKKKFIVETNYCITLDRVPEELYPQVLANDAQREEWIKLFAIDEIEGDTVTPAYSKPLTVKFLNANANLVLDTRFFDEIFKAKLLSSIEDFDEQCDGLLIHSENFQALNLLQESCREQVKCVYIDPPYNTGNDGFTYKDSYQHSSWISLFSQSHHLSYPISSHDCLFFASIDDNEVASMRHYLDLFLGRDSFESQIVIQSNKRGQTYQAIAKTHEYLIVYNYGSSNSINELAKDINSQSLIDENGPYELWELRNRNPKFNKSNRPNLYYPIYLNPQNKNKDGYASVSLTKSAEYFVEVFPKNSVGNDSCWRWGQEKVGHELKQDVFNTLIGKQKKDGDWNIYEKSRKTTKKAKSIWTETEVINEKGTIEVGALGHANFGFPKPIGLLVKVIQIGLSKTGLILDYFAGSGTTGHAVINLNRDDDGKRKYILVEMGDYFDTVLKPRISKVVYSKDWKDGKPSNRDTGVSHCFKYLRLESYEDTLNNLVLTSESNRDNALAGSPTLKEDYLLHYMLDVESKGSQSLLNIDAFSDPTAYTLKVKKPGSDEYVKKAVDLIETFNYLIGLRLVHLAEPKTFNASFTRLKDPDLPQDQDTRLVIDQDLKQAVDGKWWIRKVEGWVPKNPYNPNDCLKEKVLIVWRKLTGNLEEDNLVLDTWFQKNRINTLDWEFNTIYVNGSNNLPNLLLEGDTWKVRLIEEEFMKRMWDNQGV